MSNNTNLEVSMTSSDGVTLATKGTLCTENIKVTPVLATVTVTSGSSSQSYTPLSGMVGFSSVTVTADGYNNGVTHGSEAAELRIESILKTI